MIGLGVKVPGGRPTELQAAVLEEMRHAGTLAAVVTSVEDVVKVVKVGG